VVTSESQAKSLSAKQASLVAVFAALSVAVIILLPGIPMIGLPGARITLDAAIAPVYGLVIGPYLGALAALLGGIIVAGYKGWPVFAILTSFCPAVSAFVAGMLSRKRVSIMSHSTKGWILAALTVFVLILSWYMTWVGQQAPLYPIIHWAGLVVIVVFRGKISTFMEEGGGKRASSARGFLIWRFYRCLILMFLNLILKFLNLILKFLKLPLVKLPSARAARGRLSLAVFLSSYCGLIADHMLGNIIFIVGLGLFIPTLAVDSILHSMGLPSIPALFMFMLPISGAERLLMAVIAMIFGAGLITVLRSSRLTRNQ